MSLPIPQSTRLSRMYSERHYLLHFKFENEMSVLSVSGSTGNIYTIVIDKNEISCNCPDFRGYAREDGVYCKHCCFVIYRVLSSHLLPRHVEPRNIDVDTCKNWQKLLAQKQLDQLQHVALPSLCKKYEISHKKENNIHLKDFGVVSPQDCKKIDKLNDPCGICYEDLKDAKCLVECGECLNLLHKECADIWLRNGTVETCVYCRVPLVYAFYLQNQEKKRKKSETDDSDSYENIYE